MNNLSVLYCSRCSVQVGGCCSLAPQQLRSNLKLLWPELESENLKVCPVLSLDTCLPWAGHCNTQLVGLRSPWSTAVSIFLIQSVMYSWDSLSQSALSPALDSGLSHCSHFCSPSAFLPGTACLRLTCFVASSVFSPWTRVLPVVMSHWGFVEALTLVSQKCHSRIWHTELE